MKRLKTFEQYMTEMHVSAEEQQFKVALAAKAEELKKDRKLARIKDRTKLAKELSKMNLSVNGYDIEEWDEHLMLAAVILGTHTVDNMGQVMFESVNEKKMTIDVDLVDLDSDIKKAMKKFKVSAKWNGATSNSADLTGKKEDLIKYLTSDYYGLEMEDVEEMWPELFEATVNEGKQKPVKWHVAQIKKEFGKNPATYEVAGYCYNNYTSITGYPEEYRDEDGHFPWEIEKIIDIFDLDYTDFSQDWG